MKLKQYIKAACLFSFVAVTTSCMDLEPLSDLGDNLVWDNAANFQLFANQFYSWPHDFDRAVSDEPHSDYRSDLVAGSSMYIARVQMLFLLQMLITPNYINAFTILTYC